MLRKLGCILLLFVSSCTVRATEPVAYVETTAAPVYVDAYPSTVYDGRVVYYVNDRWMYRDGGRWAYYRSEPAPLQQYRQRTYVRSAPAAPPRARSYPSQPYPGRTYPAPHRGPSSAPPAGGRTW
jgi:hypothetical protein